MKKLKENYNKLQKQLENPRIRAIVILSLYAIFFILVIVLLNLGGKGTTAIKRKPTEDSKNQIIDTQNYKNISSNYKYECNIEYNLDGDTTKYLLTGQFNQTNKINEVSIYDNETDNYNTVEKPSFINDDFILLDKIISYVNEKEYEFSTTYKDKTIMKNYKVPLSDINDTYSKNTNIEVSVYELDNKIIKIIVDSTNYDKLNNSEVKNVLYTINYENIE